jgi:methionine sulfoxide reductase heme-binding subunit
LISLLIIIGFWLSRTDLGADARIWRALGDAAFMLLAITLIIGPLAKLFPMKFAKLISWRRETGIWTAIIAISHNVAVQSLWFQGNFMELLGYALVNGNYVHVNPGFGLANLLGLVAIIMMTLLLATSSNFAVNFLGNKAWKFLHMSAYTVFYLVSFHIIYHVFMQGSWQNNWFSILFIITALTVILLQTLAFLKMVRMEKKKELY